MRIQFMGAAGTVTGSCHYIEAGDVRLLVDCGLFQGPRVLRERNYQNFPFNPSKVNYLLLTHAHIDHSGLIPKLIKQGFKGKIFATSATVDLCEVMLPDSGYIQEMEVERLNRKNKRAGKPLLNPIYSVDEARESMKYFERVNYGDMVSLTPDVKVRFLDAGHILGSSLVEIWVQESEGQTKIVFTGDLGRDNKPYLKDPEDIFEADYIIMESTYGSRLHQDTGNRLEVLSQVLWETYHKGGNLVIPAFAVERTQDLLYDINKLMIAKKFPPMKVFIDSPMAIAATEVFRKHPECFDQDTREYIKSGHDPLNIPGLTFTKTTEESMELNRLSGGAVILSASGMCDAGRIKHHLKHNLWRKESTVLFVGYQAPGTKGRKIMEGAKMVRIHGEDIAVRASIKHIDGFSAHADQEELLEWLGNFKKAPKKVFLVHGESDAAVTLAHLIEKKLRYSVAVPLWKEEFQLSPGLVVSREAVQNTYSQVAAKLNALLEGNAGQVGYQSILRQLEDLNGLIDNISGNGQNQK